jgi:hypothetical protein
LTELLTFSAMGLPPMYFKKTRWLLNNGDAL